MIGMNMAEEARQRRFMLWLLSKVIDSDSRKLGNDPAKRRHKVFGRRSGNDNISRSGAGSGREG